MKKTEKKDLAPTPPPRANKGDLEETKDHDSHPHFRHVKRLGTRCKQFCLLSTYTSLSVLGILISVATIIISILASVAIKLYDADQSNRLMAMVIVAVTGAVTVSMLIYAVTGAFRKKTKALHAASIVLFIIVVLQALIAGVAIHVTEADELSIGKSLADSFQHAKVGVTRHVNLWAVTQHDLHCCGLNSAEDYRDLALPPYFPPNVPISCCPSYDPDKPAHTQERQKELCKVNGTFFLNGCRASVIHVFSETGSAIVGILVLSIVVELITAIVGLCLIRKLKNIRKSIEAENEEAPKSLQQKA